MKPGEVATITRQPSVRRPESEFDGETSEVRERVLTGLPLTERRLELAGVSTAVLEGGAGPPIVLLHGPGEYAAKWMMVIPDLVATHQVIVPDLPGHGTSVVSDGPIGKDRSLAWLGDLIEQTCTSLPVLIGQIIGGAIAARFACDKGDSLRRLVLVDALGLAPFQPSPEFGQALGAFMSEPTDDNHDRLWQRCAYDLDRLKVSLGDRWESLKAYNLDRARTTSLHADQQSLMQHFGLPAIPERELSRISVPTSLIWGRHDLATPLSVAEKASVRYGWPLHVIEDAADDPPLEQPQRFIEVLRTVLTSA